MNEGQKIHQILEYMCSRTNQSGFDTDKIADTLGLPTHEVNDLGRELIAHGDAKDCSTKDNHLKGSIGLLKITETNDAFASRKYLKETVYHVYISTQMRHYNIFNLTPADLDMIVNAYHDGEEHITILGEVYFIANVFAIKFFSADEPLDVDRFKLYCRENHLSKSVMGRKYYPPEALERAAKDLTSEIIGNRVQGGMLKKSKTIDAAVNYPPNDKASFIDVSRIEELREILHPDFDLRRLIKLCEEVNDNYSRGNFLSVGMIGRTILNHLPPIFKFQSFDEVANNYGGAQNKSFKGSMIHLNSSLKHIADSFLHQAIRKSESLPNATQVDFRQDLDVLLGEVVRLLNQRV